MNYLKKDSQRGAALITSLLIVMVISILGVAIGQQVIALRKISTINYDQALSITHAESALATVHEIITSNIASPEIIEGLSIPLMTNPGWWRNANNWASAAEVTAVTDVTTKPVYLIEDAGLDNIYVGVGDPSVIRTHFYRVTSASQGKGGAVAFLQTYYATPE